MRLRMGTASVALVALAFVLAGCGSNVAGPGISQDGEPAQVTRAIDGALALVYDGLSGTEQGTPAAASASRGAEVATAIHPLTFWRTIERERRTFDFAFADTDTAGRPTLALVTIHRHLRGTFNIVTGSQDDPAQAERLIRKPLDDWWTRKVLLRRVPADDVSRGLWRVAAVSGVDIATAEGTTHIVSLRVRTSSRDTTITDPLALIRLRSALRFVPDDTVHLTVTTGRSDDIVILHLADRRFHFHDNGDNTYSVSWVVGGDLAWRHLGVDAMSHGTLFDDVERYDSNRWRIPFLIMEGPDRDYYP